MGTRSQIRAGEKGILRDWKAETMGAIQVFRPWRGRREVILNGKKAEDHVTYLIMFDGVRSPLYSKGDGE